MIFQKFDSFCLNIATFGFLPLTIICDLRFYLQSVLLYSLNLALCIQYFYIKYCLQNRKILKTSFVWVVSPCRLAGNIKVSAKHSFRAEHKSNMFFSEWRINQNNNDVIFPAFSPRMLFTLPIFWPTSWYTCGVTGFSVEEICFLTSVIDKM